MDRPASTPNEAPAAPSMTEAVSALARLLDGERTLAGAHGIATAALESLYGVTRELYSQGHHAEAQRSLELLCLYNHEQARYWHALGICRKTLQDFPGAASALAFAVAQSDEFAPDLELELVECLIAAGEMDAARVRLAPLLAVADASADSGGWPDRARIYSARIAGAEAGQ